VPGVALTTLLAGGLVSIGAGLALPYALVFGALVSATDPVAVVAVFRSLGAPTRLQVLLEGESLLNDGTAIVIFNLMLAAALTGKINLPGSLVQFLIVSIGGIAVGGVVGFLISHLISKINHPMVETSLTTVIAYGSYLLAEYVFGVSGVLAVVAAGLASGEMGPQGMSPTTRIAVFHFWEYAAFLANTFVFLIIGLETDPANLLRNIPAILWAIAAVLISRAAIVYGLSFLRRDIPIQWKNILFWGGLRGAICLALALSLSAAIPNRAQIQAMAFGVVLFTLLVQGLTMRPLVKNSIAIRTSDSQIAYERDHASAIALRAASDHLRQLYQQGVISRYTLDRLQPVLEDQAKSLTVKAHAELAANPVLSQEELAMAWVESLRVRRATLTALYHDHILSEDSYLEMASGLDLLLADPKNAWRKIQGDLASVDENPT
jgi:monovalent cation:H+ antiporter, CPA1 family